MIIEGIKTAEGDDERLRDYVQGEALVWRAYSYFKLLQYFSPYKQDEYGVPVYLKPYEDPGNAMPKRETQTNVYKRILMDCQEALDLMERTPSTTWNCAYNPRFLHGMLSRPITSPTVMLSPNLAVQYSGEAMTPASRSAVRPLRCHSGKAASASSSSGSCAWGTS